MPQTISPWDVLTSGGKYEDREKDPSCTSEVRAKAADTAERVSRLLDRVCLKANVSSGFRTSSSNSKAGGARLSAHLTGEAVDLEDPHGALSDSINVDSSVLDEFDLYMENTYYTKGWVHLQTRPTKSGRRIFVP